MEVLKQLIGWTLSIAFVGVLLSVLAAIVRFSIISPLLTRGAEKRLRNPETRGLESLVGFPPGAELASFFKKWPHLEKTEYYLVDTANSAQWFIGGFIPLSKADVKEWLKVTGRHGIPIADDMNKGTYFVQSDGTIGLRSPNVAGGFARVARSIEELQNFAVAEHEDLFPHEDA